MGKWFFVRPASNIASFHLPPASPPASDSASLQIFCTRSRTALRAALGCAANRFSVCACSVVASNAGIDLKAPRRASAERSMTVEAMRVAGRSSVGYGRREIVDMAEGIRQLGLPGRRWI